MLLLSTAMVTPLAKARRVWVGGRVVVGRESRNMGVTAWDKKKSGQVVIEWWHFFRERFEVDELLSQFDFFFF